MATDNSEYSAKPDAEMMTVEQINNMVNPIIGNGHVSAAELAFSEWISATDTELQQNYVTYRQYYDGNHTQQLTDRMKQFVELVPNISFDYNFVPLAIDIIREVIAERRLDPGQDDFLSTLLRIEAENKGFEEGDIITLILALIGAGADTTLVAQQWTV